MDIQVKLAQLGFDPSTKCQIITQQMLNYPS